MIAACAAGHPATADAGAEILAEGGSAADAAVAACLASCVAETVMSGLLGGGHALHLDAATGRIEHLDCFVAAPGLGGAAREPELRELRVPFGEELVHYAVGPGTCAVPGIPAGLGALHERHGRLPWPRLVEPALRLARAGVAMPPAHVACLRMLEPVMTLDAGARIYAPGGRLLAEGELLRQPGLVPALEALAAEGARSAYEGTLGAALLALLEERGGLVTRADLRAYRAQWRAPVRARLAGHAFHTRGGLSGVPETLARLPRLAPLDPAQRVGALAAALVGPGAEGHTTNLTVVDGDGGACVFTHSLGLGSGDFLPGFDLHLNSMLGETDLLTGSLAPGERMQSMMAPSLALGPGGGLALAIGAAGGTRLRTALVTVAAGILDEGLDPASAIERPRFHPFPGTVNAEPGVDERGLAALEEAGWTVRRWPGRHHYFGGVSAVTPAAAAGDPRRSGAARSPR